MHVRMLQRLKASLQACRHVQVRLEHVQSDRMGCYVYLGGQ